MATPFDALDAKVSGAVDRAFGETFTFSAFAVAGGDVDAPKTADVTRATFAATAVWDGPAKSATPHARGSIQDDNAHNWSASMPSISVADANLLWRPQPGDRVTRAFDGAVYQIVTPLPDGMGRTTIRLSNRKR